MCFYISHQKGLGKKQIATKNIPVYKVLRRYNHALIGIYITEYTYFDDRTTKKEILHESELIRDPGMMINKGLHSCSTIRIASNIIDVHGCGTIIQAYIPIGATYYYNPNEEEYVSNKLVVYTSKDKRVKTI